MNPSAKTDVSRIIELVRMGEGISVEFKDKRVRPESLAKEMVAFSNTGGGTILIGVADDGSIEGIDESKDYEQWVANVARSSLVPAVSPETKLVTVDGRNVVHIEVARGTAKPYQTVDGRFWVRVGSTNRQATKEELSRLFQAAGLVHFDASPVEGTSFGDLRPEHLEEYWSTHYQIAYDRMSREEQTRLLKNADILGEHDKETVATVAGTLIFGKNPQRRLPQSTIVFSAYRGTEITDPLADKKNLEGTLPDLIDASTGLIDLYVPKPSKIEGTKREESEAIPKAVMREAVVNAVCHRDYSMATRRIGIARFDDRVEITSPGRLGNTLNIEKIKVGNSAPRNMLLLKFLDNMRYIDGLGRGIPLMIKLMGNRVTFEELGDLFRVTLRYEE